MRYATLMTHYGFNVAYFLQKTKNNERSTIK
jgi:hypothetical protein